MRKCRVIIIFILTGIFPDQNLMAAEKLHPSPEKQTIPTDSTLLKYERTFPDSLSSEYDFGYSSTYQYYPMNSYFHDSYRFIYDLRRLFRVIDYHSVRGYETISELFEISQQFPKEKQTLMIGAGGALNLLAVHTNRTLSKYRINFIRWKLEKLLLRKSFKHFNVNMYAGWNINSFGINFPSYRFFYSHHRTNMYKTNSFTWWLTWKLGLNYTKYNNYKLLTPMMKTKYGRFAVSYDRSKKLLISRYSIRKSPFLVIRIIYTDYLENREYNRLQSEIFISW